MNPIDHDIPEAELDVLSALWRLRHGTVRDVRAALEERGRTLAHNTVLTLLGRLEQRGCVACNRDGAANVYRPVVTRRRVARRRLGQLVEQLGGGDAAPLILQLLRDHRLSQDDLRELRELVAKLESQNRREGGPDDA